MSETCHGCGDFSYACADYFCNHPGIPVVTEESPWPWLHYPYRIPDWCPKEVEK